LDRAGDGHGRAEVALVGGGDICARATREVGDDTRACALDAAAGGTERISGLSERGVDVRVAGGGGDGCGLIEAESGRPLLHALLTRLELRRRHDGVALHEFFGDAERGGLRGCEVDEVADGGLARGFFLVAEGEVDLHHVLCQRGGKYFRQRPHDDAERAETFGQQGDGGVDERTDCAGDDAAERGTAQDIDSGLHARDELGGGVADRVSQSAGHCRETIAFCEIAEFLCDVINGRAQRGVDGLADVGDEQAQRLPELGPVLDFGIYLAVGVPQRVSAVAHGCQFLGGLGSVFTGHCKHSTDGAVAEDFCERGL
jgi:hypothetical protein